MSLGEDAPERFALSTDLNEFLVEFSIALHRTLIYPPGHPSQARSASGVVHRLATLLADRPSVSIGIARHQLVIEGIATDPRHPMLRSLAEKFHLHHIGAIVFNRGVSTTDIAGMLRLVAAERDKDAPALGLGPADQLRQWEHVRLYPMSYDQLELVGDPDEDGDGDDEQRDIGTRSAQLWIGMARAAMSVEETDVEPPSTDPTVVAQAINEHPQAQAYDQILVGYLLQIAQELKKDGGSASATVRRRMSRLIGALDADTLNRLVEMGGSLPQRRQFTLDATESLAADAVVEIVRAAATTSGKPISNSLMRMLTKLSAFAESGSSTLQVRADTELRSQVRELVQGWTLLDPNPDSYTIALQSMSRGFSGERSGEAEKAPEPLRIVQMALEVDAVGVPFWRAAAQMTEGGQVPELVATLEAAPADNAAAARLWKQLAAEDIIRALLLREEDFKSVGALLDRVPAETATNMLLDTLVESHSRSMRMSIYRRLIRMGPEATDPIAARLSDTRWYVQRNMLALLNERGWVPSVFSPAELARHDDPRVRREAMIMWLRIPQQRDRAMLQGLKDADERVVRCALAAAAEHGIHEMTIPAIAAKLDDGELGPDVRLQLVRVLAISTSAAAADALLGLVVAGKTFMGAPRFTETTPIMLLALTQLLERWPTDARVAALAGRIPKTKDPQLMAVLAKMKVQ